MSNSAYKINYHRTYGVPKGNRCGDCVLYGSILGVQFMCSFYGAKLRDELDESKSKYVPLKCPECWAASLSGEDISETELIDADNEEKRDINIDIHRTPFTELLDTLYVADAGAIAQIHTTYDKDKFRIRIFPSELGARFFAVEEFGDLALNGEVIVCTLRQYLDNLLLEKEKNNDKR